MVVSAPLALGALHFNWAIWFGVFRLRVTPRTGVPDEVQSSGSVRLADLGLLSGRAAFNQGS